MSTNVLDYIKEISEKENRHELMMYYLKYVLTRNIFRNADQSPPCKIAKDITILSAFLESDKSNTSFIYKKKYKSKYVRERIKSCQKSNLGKKGIQEIVNESHKYIEEAFLLKSFEKQIKNDRYRYFISTLFAITALIISFITLIIKITNSNGE